MFWSTIKTMLFAVGRALKIAYDTLTKGVKIASNWLMDNILKKFNILIFFAIITIVSLILRIKLFDFQSSDYMAFLEQWCLQIATNGGFKDFGNLYGYDYTMPYLYILTTISYLKPEHWLYGIKAVSIFFDFVLAVFVGLIAKKITKSNTSMLVGYSLTLLLPNVILNGAVWGQCDVMYSTFCVMSLYFLICGNGKARIGLLLYGLAFSLKLQAIFFLPVILLVMAKKKVNFFFFIYAVLAYFSVNIPAFLLGVSFSRAIIEPIKTQTSEYASLSSNAVNLYFIIDKMAHYGMYEGEPNLKWKEWFAPALLMFAIGVVVLAFLIIYRKKFKLTAKRLVLISYFFAMLVPYVLPHMHERYWFLSDVLAVLFIICYRKHFYIAFLSCYSSFRICVNFLFDTGVAGDMNRILLVLLMLTAIILTFRLIYKELNDEGVEIGEGEMAKSLPISPKTEPTYSYSVTDLNSGNMVETCVVSPLGTITEQGVDDFLSETTQQETELMQDITKVFGDLETLEQDFEQEDTCKREKSQEEN